MSGLFRSSTTEWLLLRILPICSICHQSIILFVSTASKLFGGLTMKFVVFHLCNRLVLNLWFKLRRRRPNHAILRALLKISLVVSEKSWSATALSSKFLSIYWVLNGIAKNWTWKSVTATVTRSIILRTSKNVTFECVLFSLSNALFRGCATWLNSSNICWFGSKNVWILVRRSCCLVFKWYIFKVWISLIFKSFVSLMVRIQVEDITLLSIGVTCFCIIIDYILIWMTKYICSVLFRF